jgi:hypothetical protein
MNFESYGAGNVRLQDLELLGPEDDVFVGHVVTQVVVA